VRQCGGTVVSDYRYVKVEVEEERVRTSTVYIRLPDPDGDLDIRKVARANYMDAAADLEDMEWHEDPESCSIHAASWSEVSADEAEQYACYEPGAATGETPRKLTDRLERCRAEGCDDAATDGYGYCEREEHGLGQPGCEQPAPGFVNVECESVEDCPTYYSGCNCVGLPVEFTDREKQVEARKQRLRAAAAGRAPRLTPVQNERHVVEIETGVPA